MTILHPANRPRDSLHRDLWRLALPLMASNLSVPLLGMADTTVMGHLDHPAYIGAIALGGIVFSFLYWGFGFLRMGTSGLTAQAFGGDRLAEVHAVLWRALLVAQALAIGLILARHPIAELAFQWIGGSPLATQFARRYFEIRIFSAPATLLNFVLVGWFIGLQNTRVPMLLMLISNLLNIGLDFLLVRYWHWEIEGVALASVIAEYTSLGLGLGFVVRQYQSLGLPRNWSLIVAWQPLRALISVNSNLFLRTLLLIFSFAFFTSQSALLGDKILAANTILMNFQSLMAYVLDGFAHACEALAGRFHGANNVRKIRLSVQAAGRLSWTGAFLFSLGYLLWGERLIGLMTSQEVLQTLAREKLLFATLLPVISVGSFLFDGVFVGLARAREMRNVMVLSTLLIYLPTWWWLRPWGNTGLWLAFTAFMAGRSLLMWVYWKKIIYALSTQFRNVPF